MEHKTCKDCGLFKPIEEFYLLRKGGRYRQSYCIPCSKERNAPASKRHKEKYGKRDSDNHRRSAHGRAAILYRAAKRRATSKGLPFTLTPERVISALKKGTCEVTGLEFDMDVNKKRQPFAPSIDRIELELGYTDDNVQIVVWMHNMVRCDWGNEPLKKYLKSFLTKIQ